jgi:hypothetical protein
MLTISICFLLVTTSPTPFFSHRAPKSHNCESIVLKKKQSPKTTATTTTSSSSRKTKSQSSHSKQRKSSTIKIRIVCEKKLDFVVEIDEQNKMSQLFDLIDEVFDLHSN